MLKKFFRVVVSIIEGIKCPKCESSNARLNRSLVLGRSTNGAIREERYHCCNCDDDFKIKRDRIMSLR